MPAATPLRLFSPHFALLLAIFAGLASSCQSSRPGFAFQPAPGRPARVTTAASLAAPPDSVGATAATVTGAHSPQRPAQARSQERRLAPAARVAAVAKAALVPKTARSATGKRRVLLQRPHGTAEVGLGTTVLGVLGLVALPIALIGLAISGGGLVWAIVAGAAALAVLVAYLDPFGR